ncbi:unnamed protein product [Withania somnifera]
MLEQDIVSVAQYVLVFCKRNQCTVITGRGYPDILTMRFLCLLIDKLYLIVYCLLGIFFQDCNNYSILQQRLLPLTAEDKRNVEAMLRRCYLQRELPKWRFELELPLHKGVKFEIEALSVYSLTFLSHEYLSSKIHNKGYI